MLYKNEKKKKRKTTSTASLRINKSGSPLDVESHIKLLHQQPRLGGSTMTTTEKSPLMRHKPLRDAAAIRQQQQVECEQHRIAAGMNNCNATTTSMTSSAGSRKTLIRPLSQSALYLARPSSSFQMRVAQTSLTNLVGSGCSSDGINVSSCNNQGQQQIMDDDGWQWTRPQLEISLVYVCDSAQLLVHIHRLSNATPDVRCGKESTSPNNTQVKVKTKQHFLYICYTRIAATLRNNNYASRNQPLAPKKERNAPRHCDSTCVVV